MPYNFRWTGTQTFHKEKFLRKEKKKKYTQAHILNGEKSVLGN